jgi:hypothetical protein
LKYNYKLSNGTASSSTSRTWGPVFGASIVAFAVGTGGLSGSSYMNLAKRQERGYRIFAFENPAQELSIAGRTTIEDLERIRAILKPAVTDLAALFNVSRQTIYDWQAGQPTSQRNMDVLAEMAKAADLFSREGVDAPANLLRRKLRGGRTYAEEIAAGASSYELLASSLKALKRETEQRKVLATRFAGRKTNRDRMSELLTPMLDEQG